MRTTELGRTGMEISRVGFGAVAVAWTLRNPRPIGPARPSTSGAAELEAS